MTYCPKAYLIGSRYYLHMAYNETSYWMKIWIIDNTCGDNSLCFAMALRGSGRRSVMSPWRHVNITTPKQDYIWRLHRTWRISSKPSGVISSKVMIKSNISTHLHWCVHACINACIYICIHTCSLAYVRTYIFVNFDVLAQAGDFRIEICLHAYMSCTHVIHTCPAYMSCIHGVHTWHACMAYMAYIHTYIHTIPTIPYHTIRAHMHALSYTCIYACMHCHRANRNKLCPLLTPVFLSILQSLVKRAFRNKWYQFNGSKNLLILQTNCYCLDNARKIHKGEDFKQ